jgi:catechol 2,3-dioxygenase-like lactoylglutathione lyase family enzyme
VDAGFASACASTKMARGDIHHLDLTVSDLEISKVFYESILGFMGYRISDMDPDGYDFHLVRPDMPFTSIGILRQHRAQPHDRYTPGLHHIAWRAESREDVDAMYAHLLKLNAQILDPPAAYPRYGDGYYAVFFSDPDGLKLEYVYKP